MLSKLFVGVCAVVILLTVALATAQEPTTEEPPEDPDGFRVFWNDGLRAETNDGRFQLRLGGRLQMDFNWVFDKEPFEGLLGTFENGSELRRARLFVQGYMWERVEYKFQVDFAGGEVGAKDMYIGIRGWPVTARVGHLKEPFSLEEVTSSRFITFMERSLVNMFAPSRNTGLFVLKRFNDSRSSWAGGAFRETDGFAASTGDNYNFTTRLTHAAIHSDDHRRLLHFALALQHKEVDGILRLTTRPGDHNAPRVIDIRLPAESANYTELEVAANIGALSLQAEYLSAWVQSTELGNPRLWGYYVQASYALTGEARPYDRGRWGRFSPARNFPDGAGAWELGLRYARVDLSEASPEPPNTLWDLTVGLNWYWNANARWMFNYDRAGIPEISGEDFSVFHTRLMFDF